MITGQDVMAGKFIAVEGLDGVGKTTQTKLLADHWAHLGLPVVLTREPTDGSTGKKIRQIIQHGRHDLPPAEELALFIADRREHVRTVIQPALAAGKLVITDRYYFSTMAYQGALGLDPRDIRRRHQEFAPAPDLVIIVELDLAEISRRLEQRGRTTSFEKIDYLAKVASIFQQLDGPGLVRLSGLGTEAEVHLKILAAVCRFFDLPENPNRRPAASLPR